MTEKDKEKIIENNKMISKLLDENENILRQAGYDPPRINYSVDKMDRITFPPRYIRTVQYFIKKYHLLEIIKDRQLRHNITYALQESDLINYILSRVNVWGPVETILYKLAIVNFVSIIEAIVLQASNNICYEPGMCGNTKKCSVHFSKYERGRSVDAIRRLVAIDVLDYDEKKIEEIQELVNLRNTIHIQLAKYNEMKKEIFCLEKYNEVVYLLHDITEQIYNKAVPLYKCGGTRLKTR